MYFRRTLRRSFSVDLAFIWTLSLCTRSYDLEGNREMWLCVGQRFSVSTSHNHSNIAEIKTQVPILRKINFFLTEGDGSLA